eukprot:gene909-964_t
MLPSSHRTGFFQLQQLQRLQPFHMTGTDQDKNWEQYDIVKVKAKDVQVPLDKIDFSYARSSGPGGQNVNKLNTKAVIRFHVMSAEWIPLEARTRLAAYQATRVSKEGELIISAQDHRTQSKNKDACIQKLKEMIAEALITPKEREMWIGLSEKTKKERIEYKKRRSEIKQNRQRGRSGDDDY